MNVRSFGSNRSEDLLDKLKHDFWRLQADAGQATMLYTAFDFFVMAYSLVDCERNAKKLNRKQVNALYDPIRIKICADLANGSKHFRLTKPPKTTLTTHSSRPLCEPELYQRRLYQDSWQAWVELSTSEAAAAGVPTTCPVMTLATEVLTYWRRYFGRTV